MVEARKIQEPDPLFFDRFKIGFFLASYTSSMNSIHLFMLKCQCHNYIGSMALMFLPIACCCILFLLSFALSIISGLVGLSLCIICISGLVGFFLVLLAAGQFSLFKTNKFGVYAGFWFGFDLACMDMIALDPLLQYLRRKITLDFPFICAKQLGFFSFKYFF
jgi:hypothetical protein